MPHITLGHGDVTRENLGATIELLSGWEFTWQIRTENVALPLSQDNARQDPLQHRISLPGT